jgi:uncharacterized membrane protein
MRTAVLGHVLFGLYPLLIFAGLHFLDPRGIGLLLLVALALRHRAQVAKLVSRFSPTQVAALALPFVLGAAVFVTNSEPLLRLYPTSISASMLVLFGLTLVHPPTMVERFARLQAPDLPPAHVRYTRRVTEVWCGFFVMNGLVSAYTALFASREAWALYNGLIAYVLMGALFLGERLLRGRLVAAT